MAGQPTLGDFQTFIVEVMGVPETALDPSAPLVGYCFDYALNWVNPKLACVPQIAPTGWTLYQKAVYNFAGDLLANAGQDQPGAPIYQDGMPYWAWLRDQYGLDNFVAGVLTSSSDQGTSASYQTAKAFENYTLSNLSNLKTPWGRAYLSIAQSYGPTAWGIN